MAYPAEADFAALLGALARQLESRRIPFMVIGGQAVLVHGEPRLTQDIDVTVGAGVDRLSDLLAATGEAGLTPLPTDVVAFVGETFVLPVVHEPSSTRVDIVLSNTEYEACAISRAQPITVGGAAVPFASAEDLLLHKLFAGRPRDVDDAEGIVRRKGRELDWTYIRKWAREFAQVAGREELPTTVARLQRDAQA